MIEEGNEMHKTVEGKSQNKDRHLKAMRTLFLTQNKI
jgi:hypothetical protein